MSAASLETLRRWFDDGVRKRATHMIVACDTFDHGDFPVYVMPGEDAREVAKKYESDSKMLRVMEVYDLRSDREEQMAASRVFNYGDSRPKPRAADPSSREEDEIVSIMNASEQLVGRIRRLTAKVAADEALGVKPASRSRPKMKRRR